MSGYPRKHPTARWAMPRGPECDCGECSRRYQSNWDNEPILGSVNGEHEAYFKTSRNGETLISDAKHGAESFDSTPEKRGTHDHFGSGNGRNNNGTSRGYYTGPGH